MAMGTAMALDSLRSRGHNQVWKNIGHGEMDGHGGLSYHHVPQHHRILAGLTPPSHKHADGHDWLGIILVTWLMVLVSGCHVHAAEAMSSQGFSQSQTALSGCIILSLRYHIVSYRSRRLWS